MSTVDISLVRSAPRRRGATGSAALPTVAILRAVAPIPLPDAVPAPLSSAAEPIFERMRPGDLMVDDSYQRELTPKSLALIRRIVEGWDWLKFKAPVVAMTDHGFEVVDGQHTAVAAACHPEIETIPVMVVDGSDLARRARAFVSHAVDRLHVRPTQVHHAAVAAGDEDAVTIARVLDRAGVTLLHYTPGDAVYAKRETISLNAVRRLVDKRGAMRAREVLEITAQADLAPITADHIRIAEALLLGQDYAGGLDADRISTALREMTPRQLAEAKELAFAKRMPAWRALTAVLYRAHHGHRVPKRTQVKAAAPAGPAQAEAVASIPLTTAETTLVPGHDHIPTVELVEGIARWTRGEPWTSAWGPPPDDAGCAVPRSLLGDELMLSGTRRREAVVYRAIAVWRQDGRWPEGWGPSPDDPGCAVPARFRSTPRSA